MSRKICMYVTVESWTFKKIHFGHRTAVCSLCLGRHTYIKLYIRGDWSAPGSPAVESGGFGAPWRAANLQLVCSHVGLKAKGVSWHEHQLLHAAWLLCKKASLSTLNLLASAAPKKWFVVWCVKKAVRTLRTDRCALALWNGRVSWISSICFIPPSFHASGKIVRSEIWRWQFKCSNCCLYHWNYFNWKWTEGTKRVNKLCKCVSKFLHSYSKEMRFVCNSAVCPSFCPCVWTHWPVSSQGSKKVCENWYLATGVWVRHQSDWEISMQVQVAFF